MKMVRGGQWVTVSDCGAETYIKALSKEEVKKAEMTHGMIDSVTDVSQSSRDRPRTCREVATLLSRDLVVFAPRSQQTPRRCSSQVSYV